MVKSSIVFPLSVLLAVGLFAIFFSGHFETASGNAIETSDVDTQSTDEEDNVHKTLEERSTGEDDDGDTNGDNDPYELSQSPEARKKKGKGKEGSSGPKKGKGGKGKGKKGKSCSATRRCPRGSTCVKKCAHKCVKPPSVHEETCTNFTGSCDPSLDVQDKKSVTTSCCALKGYGTQCNRTTKMCEACIEVDGNNCGIPGEIDGPPCCRLVADHDEHGTDVEANCIRGIFGLYKCNRCLKHGQKCDRLNRDCCRKYTNLNMGGCNSKGVCVDNCIPKNKPCDPENKDKDQCCTASGKIPTGAVSSCPEDTKKCSVCYDKSANCDKLPLGGKCCSTVTTGGCDSKRFCSPDCLKVGQDCDQSKNDAEPDQCCSRDQNYQSSLTGRCNSTGKCDFCARAGVSCKPFGRAFPDPCCSTTAGQGGCKTDKTCDPDCFKTGQKCPDAAGKGDKCCVPFHRTLTYQPICNSTGVCDFCAPEGQACSPKYKCCDRTANGTEEGCDMSMKCSSTCIKQGDKCGKDVTCCTPFSKSGQLRTFCGSKGTCDFCVAEGQACTSEWSCCGKADGDKYDCPASLKCDATTE